MLLHTTYGTNNVDPQYALFQSRIASWLGHFGATCGKVRSVNRSDNASLFYGFMMLVSIALTNIQDADADVDRELRPLIESFSVYFPNHMQTFAWLLYAPLAWKVCLIDWISGLSLYCFVIDSGVFFFQQSAAMLTNVYKSVKNMKHFSNTVLRVDSSLRRKANAHVCRWLQVICKISLLGFASFSMQKETEDIYLGLQRKKEVAKEFNGLAHALEVIWDMKADYIKKKKGKITASDFFPYMRAFQKRFHVPLLLKCMERAIQNNVADDQVKKWDKWYYSEKTRGPTKKGRTPSTAPKKPPPSNEAANKGVAKLPDITTVTTAANESFAKHPDFPTVAEESTDGIDLHEAILKPMSVVSTAEYVTYRCTGA